MKITYLNRERSLLLILQVQERKQANRWSLSKVTEGVQERTRLEPVNNAQASTSGDDTLQEQQYSIATGRERRQISPTKRYTYVDMVAYALSMAEYIEIPEPSTYNKAISSDKAAAWTVTKTEEIESLHKNQTQELVKPPREQKNFGCKWVFRKKERIPGAESVRYKARLAAKATVRQRVSTLMKLLSSCEAHLQSRVASHGCLVRSGARAL